MNAVKKAMRAADILEEACTWRLLSLLLSRPHPQTQHAVREIAREVHDPALAQIAEAWCESASEGAYHALLGPGGVVSARVVPYRGFADPGWMLAEIARIHDAFAFHPQSEEPSDHVGSLCELVSYLWLKEAYARELGDENAIGLTREAREHIVNAYLAPVAAVMAERLEACGANQWSAVASCLAAKVPPPPPQVPGIGEAEDSFSCGACVGEDRPQAR